MNTPDTEWEKELRKEIQMFFYNAEHPEVYSSYEVAMFERKVEGIVRIFQNTLTSRDTYWKERVRKEVEGMRKTKTFPQHLNGWDGKTTYFERLSDGDIHFNQALDTLLDNLN